MNQKRHHLLNSNCDNCGTVDDLQFYEHVLGGISLCEDCADLPVSKVSKSGVNWVKVSGEYFPSDLPVVKKNE